ANGCVSSVTTLRLESRYLTSPTTSTLATIRGTWRAPASAASQTAWAGPSAGSGCSSFDSAVLILSVGLGGHCMRTRALAVLCLLLIAGGSGTNLAADAEPVELRRTANQIDIFVGGGPFASYHFDPAVAKPYLSSLRSARGTVVTREFPMTNINGEDHD